MAIAPRTVLAVILIRQGLSRDILLAISRAGDLVMCRAKRLSSVLLLLLLSTALGLGQRRPADELPSPGPPNLEDSYRSPFRIERTPSREGFVRDYEPSAVEKRMLALSPEDEQRFAGFLTQVDTGGFRLLSFIRRAHGRVISVKSPEFARKRGFSFYGSCYSFTKKKHGHGVNGWGISTWGWSDLRLISGTLSTGFMDESLGLMVKLGDVPLEEVTPQTAGVAELATFALPTDHSTSAALFEKNLRGYELNGFTYGSRMDAVVGVTYVLRSTLNQRSDQLVAFRIVNQDHEGTVTILFKKLKEYPKPFWKGNSAKRK